MIVTPAPKKKKPKPPAEIAAFFDRDGTINQEKGYIRNLDDLVLIPGAAQAIRRLNDAGILTVLTTNQTGPARGFYGVDHVLALNEKVQRLLNEEAGAYLDAMYYCPHLAKGVIPEFAIDCQCRKPKPGMILSARAQYPDIILERSYMIGDKASDVEFGINAGCKTILLKTGYGSRVLEGKYQVLETRPNWVCDDISSAVDTILSDVLLPH